MSTYAGLGWGVIVMANVGVQRRPEAVRCNDELAVVLLAFWALISANSSRGIATSAI